MKRVLLAGVFFAVMAAVGCSNSTTSVETATESPVPEEIPPCDEVFAAGNMVDPATFGNACRTGDDELAVPRPSVLACQDGRTLMWNDLAWGYEGGTMQLWGDAVVKVPSDQALGCLRQTSDTTAAS